MGREVVNYGSTIRDGTGDELHIAFAKLDAAARAFTVIDKDLTAPPGSPAIGDVYIVGAASTGAWSGEDGNIAVFGLASTWRFVTAAEGMLAFVLDEGSQYRHSGSEWLAVSGTITPFDRGTISSGTETPAPSDGPMQEAINDGAEVTGETWPLTMDYVAASDGDYRAVLSNELPLEARHSYVATITADGGSDRKGQWQFKFRPEIRR